MPVDGAFWRSLREDFESLQGHQFSLIWNSSPPLSFTGEPLDSHWSWLQFPDDSLKARLSAIALKGARALGYDSEEAWYDLLRTSGFVRFQLSGSTRQRRSDGVMVDSTSGQIEDVVKESITLCHELEGTQSPSRLAGRQPRRNPKYASIDDNLRKIAQSHPSSHKAVFQLLEGRARIPNAEPFRSAQGWCAGFAKNPVAARAWLSKQWARLKLPPFPRGPK
jgi:hypothetical protein